MLSLLLIIIPIVLIIILIIILTALLFLRKRKKEEDKERFTISCPSLTSSNSESTVTWSLSTDTTTYNNLALQPVKGSNVPQVVQGILIDPCNPQVSFYYSAPENSGTINLTSGSLFTNTKITLTQNSGDYYQGTASDSSQVYLYATGECSPSGGVPVPKPYFVEENTDISNQVSIGETTANLYMDSTCTQPYLVQGIVSDYAPSATPFLSSVSNLLYVEAWGPMTVGLSDPTDGRFQSLLQSSSPPGTNITTYQGKDSKYFLVTASSTKVSPFSIFIYNTHTGKQSTLSVSFLGGLVFITPTTADSSFAVNTCVRTTTTSTNIGGYQISNANVLIVGPEIPTPTVPIPVSTEPASDVDNPTPSNLQLPLTMTSSSSPPHRLLLPEKPVPSGVTQAMLQQALVETLPRFFDWRIVGRGRIEARPRNQRRTRSCNPVAVASVIGDAFALAFNVLAPYPAAIGIATAAYISGQAIRPQALRVEDIVNAVSGGFYTRLERSWPWDQILEVIYNNVPGFIGNVLPYSEQGVTGSSTAFQLTFEVTRMVPIVVQHAIDYRLPFSRQQILTIRYTVMATLVTTGTLLTSAMLGQHFKAFWDALPSMTDTELENAVYIPSVDDVDTEGADFHALVIVGYGVTTDRRQLPYWIIRNSWGNNGDNGHIRIAMATEETQSLNCVELPYTDGAKTKFGPVYFKLRGSSQQYLETVQRCIDAGVLKPAPELRFDLAGATPPPCVRSCPPNSNCSTSDGCGGFCCPLLVPQQIGQGTDPRVWVLNNNPTDTLLNFPGGDQSNILYSPRNQVQRIEFSTFSSGGTPIEENGIRIVSSTVPGISAGWIFQYNSVTGSYYRRNGVLGFSATFTTLSPEE